MIHNKTTTASILLALSLILCATDSQSTETAEKKRILAVARTISLITDEIISPDEIRDLIDDSSPSHGQIVPVEVKSKDLDRCLANDDPYSCLVRTLKPWVEALRIPAASGTASLIATTVLYPLDYWKLQKQLQNNRTGSLIKGFIPYTAALTLTSGIHFPLYESMKDSGLSPALAGGLSGLASTVLSSPAWVYYTKMSDPTYSFSCFRKDIAAKPSLAMSGLGVGMLCLLPQALQFHLYEKFVAGLTDSDASSIFTSHEKAFALVGSKLLVSTFSFPMDTIRRVRQKTELPYQEIIRTLYGEGILRFYRGFFLQSAKQSLWAAGFMKVYLEMKELFGCEVNSEARSKSPELK